MIGTVISLVIGVVIGYLVRIAHEWKIKECPRVIRGYNCRGEGCDHSARSIAEAKWDIHRS